MWSKQLKDKKIRIKFEKKEVKSLVFSFLINDPLLDSVTRFSLNKKFLSKNKNNFRTQIKNRCSISLRSRSPLRDFHLSRVFFRSQASSGVLLGIKKSS